jgi:hypothetical protein
MEFVANWISKRLLIVVLFCLRFLFSTLVKLPPWFDVDQANIKSDSGFHLIFTSYSL